VSIYIYKNRVGSLHYKLTDHLGSIRALVDEQANIEEELSFDAWGRPRDAATWAYTGTTR